MPHGARCHLWPDDTCISGPTCTILYTWRCETSCHNPNLILIQPNPSPSPNPKFIVMLHLILEVRDFVIADIMEVRGRVGMEIKIVFRLRVRVRVSIRVSVTCGVRH